MENDDCKKILDAIVEMWYQKVLNKIVAERKGFDQALEEIMQEMINGE